MFSKLTVKTPERRRWKYLTPFSSVSIVDFEQVTAGWKVISTYAFNIKKYFQISLSYCTEA